MSGRKKSDTRWPANIRHCHSRLGDLKPGFVHPWLQCISYFECHNKYTGSHKSVTNTSQFWYNSYSIKSLYKCSNKIILCEHTYSSQSSFHRVGKNVGISLPLSATHRSSLDDQFLMWISNQHSIATLRYRVRHPIYIRTAHTPLKN
jgi:hypothetical protein